MALGCVNIFFFMYSCGPLKWKLDLRKVTGVYRQVYVDNYNYVDFMLIFTTQYRHHQQTPSTLNAYM